MDYGSELANVLVAFLILGAMAGGLIFVLVRQYKRKH